MSHPFTVGIHLDGAGSHPAAWRRVPGGEAELLAPARQREVIGVAEAAGLSYATLAGSHLPPDGDPERTPRLDPVQLASFAGPLTSGIGLIPEVPVTYVEPFHIATQLASLDYSSLGRAGWLVSTENSPEAAREYGRQPLEDEELAAEVVDVVAVNRALWDSWEHDAVIRDLPTGRFIDRDKLHYVDYEGRSFSVKGPAITPRPPQGQLPVVVPAAHAEGVAADIVVARSETEAGAARAADDAPIVILDLEVLLDSQGERAGARLARLDADRVWAARGAERYVGDAEGLVDRIRELSKRVDGVRIVPAEIDRDLPELRYQVLPELIEIGVLARPVTHRTLREVFGLPEAENRYRTSERSAA